MASVALATVGALGTATAASAAEPSPEPNIVGGSVVDKAPSWSAVVGTSGYGMWCSGSLVASRWVITAKHCYGAKVIRIGSKHTHVGGTLVDVEDWVANPDYDMGLYELAEPVDNKPVPIADSAPAPGTEATLYGHGQTCPEADCGGGMSPDLKSTTTTTVRDGECRTIDGDGETCFDTSITSTDCYGDSGGAAIVDDELVGVDSRGAKGKGASTCGNTNSIYGDPTAIKKWITDEISA